MKTYFPNLLAAVLACCFAVSASSVLATSCSFIKDQNIETTGPVAKVNRNLANFNSIDVCCGFKVSLSMGSADSVVVEAAESLMPYIETFVKEGKLVIRIKPDYRFKSIQAKDKPHIYISVRNLNEIDASGGSSINTVGSIRSDKFDLSLSGGSIFTGELAAQNIDCDLSGGATAELIANALKFEIDLSGGSIINLSGNSERFDAEGSGGAILNAYNFSTDRTQLSLSGGSTAKVWVNKTLKVDASGGSGVYYKGIGVVTSQLSGGSGVKQVK
ncbi:MAG: head GIN domain-containing protein [Bacteroidales bacterium]